MACTISFISKKRLATQGLWKRHSICSNNCIQRKAGAERKPRLTYLERILIFSPCLGTSGSSCLWSTNSQFLIKCKHSVIFGGIYSYLIIAEYSLNVASYYEINRTRLTRGRPDGFPLSNRARERCVANEKSGPEHDHMQNEAAWQMGTALCLPTSSADEHHIWLWLGISLHHQFLGLAEHTRFQAMLF